MTGITAAQLAAAMPDDRPETWQEFSFGDRIQAVPPTGRKEYWRLVVKDEDGRRIAQPSGGQYPSTALAKAVKEYARISADLPRAKMLTLGADVISAWTNPHQSRHGRKPWTGGTGAGNDYYLDTYIRPVLDDKRVEQWSKRHFREIVNAAPTEDEGKQVKKRLSALVHWAARAEYCTTQQALNVGLVWWEAPKGYVAPPKRREIATVAGEVASVYLPPEEVMDAEELDIIGDGLQLYYRHGTLFGETGAALGLRQGELFAMRVDYVDCPRRRYQVHDQWNQKTGTYTEPKHRKRRTAVWQPERTITGYDLDAALAARIAEVRVEQAAGRNPDGLIFPAPRGGNWNASNFDERVWVPAMAAAGISYVTYEQPVRTQRGVMRRRVLFRFTCHSLRDRYAVSALNLWEIEPNELAVLGGWKDAEVIYKRYYGATSRTLDTVQARSDARVAREQAAQHGLRAV